MKQTVQLGYRTQRFSFSRVIKVRDLEEDNLLRFLDALKTTSPFADQASVVISETLEKRGGGRQRPVKVLKAVLLSPHLWAATLAANPGAELTFSEVAIVDDFLLPQDRVTRILPRLAPTQDMQVVTTVIPAGGVVALGFTFVGTTLDSSIAPTGVNGNLGTVTYALGDVGNEVIIKCVTQPHYTVIKIDRVKPQPTRPFRDHIPPALNAPVFEPPWGYMIHPTLAAALGVALPPF